MSKKTILRLGISLILAFSFIQACNNSNPTNENTTAVNQNTSQQTGTQTNNNSDLIIDENSNISPSNNIYNKDGSLVKQGSDANPLPTATSTLSSTTPDTGVTSSPSPTPTPSASSTVLKNGGEINVLINPNPPSKI